MASGVGTMDDEHVRPAGVTDETVVAPGRLTERMHSALHEARQLHIALEVDGRPHVTPELFTWSAGKVWFASAPSTYKSRHLETGDRVAAVIGLPGRDLLLRGTVERMRPADLVRGGHRSLDAAAATARFAVRNAGDLLAFAGDAIRGRTGRRVPELRILYSLEPTAAALLENGETTERWQWDAAGADAGTSSGSGGARAVAAFAGPAALPARWFEDASELRVPPAALDLYEIPEEGAVAIVLDEYNAPGPAAKSGTMLRGTATAASDPGAFAVDVEREVGWAGSTRRPASG